VGCPRARHGMELRTCWPRGYSGDAAGDRSRERGGEREREGAAGDGSAAADGEREKGGAAAVLGREVDIRRRLG